MAASCSNGTVSNGTVATIDGDDCGTTMPIVDWHFLPEELLLRVFSKLPFSSLISSRCVCKKWNELKFPSDLLFSGNLASKCIPIYFVKGPLQVYNSRTNSWEEHSLMFLGIPTVLLALLVSAGGLLCFKHRITGNLIVCNPITKRWKALSLPDEFNHEDIKPSTLPAFWAPIGQQENQHVREAYLQSFTKEVIVAMLPQQNCKSFKLIVAGISDGSRRITLVYDSLRSSWTKGSEVPQGVRFWRSAKTIYCDGYMYCVTCSVGLPGGVCNLNSPWSVVRYNVTESSWTEYPLRDPGLVVPQLIDYRGRGLLVQKRIKNSKVEISFAELKENDPMSSIMFKPWPVDLFPIHKLKPHFQYVQGTQSYFLEDWCVGQGDWLYVARDYPDTRGLEVLAYDLTVEIWTKLPTLRDRYQLSSLWLHTFQASITASM